MDIFAFKDSLIELYSNEHAEDSFSLGYILKDLGNFFLFMSISEVGTLDSIQIRNKSFIGEMIENTEYTKMLAFFVDYSKTHHLFDAYSLEKFLPEKEELTVSDLLNQSLTNGQTISVVTSNDEQILTGKVCLLHDNKLVISLLNYENITLEKKQTIQLNDIIGIDLVNVENYLYDTYIAIKKISLSLRKDD